MKSTAYFPPGIGAAVGAAVLFGASTPLAKLLLGQISPWLLAGLFYAGSGIGLTLYRLAAKSPSVRLPRGEAKWLIAAIACGGVIAPVLLMYGLQNMPASGASLLLNAEGVFTALLAWFAFRENFDRRIALGMTFIVGGAVVLNWPGEVGPIALLPSMCVLGACFAWGLDNNFTRKVSLSDSSWIASVKGLAAGATNLALAFALGASLPHLPAVLGALAVGSLAYGVSLTLFVVALRHLGTARTGAYFSLAPFFGAALAIVLLGEEIGWQLIVSAVLMGYGVLLHLTERHAHRHDHHVLEHSHEHEHDDHHHHSHEGQLVGSHTHWHRHEPMTHEHAHFPDAHHRHEH